MSEIKVGDRVQWRPKYRHKKIPEIVTGIVRTIHNGRKPWAGIAVTKPIDGTWCVDLVRLTVINEAHELQLEAADAAHDAAAAARSDTLAIASLGVICTDYEAQMEYGDYGGREG